MKLLIVFSLCVWMMAAAEAPSKKVSSARTVASLQIPGGAVKSEDGSYRFTDSRGKKWIYCRPPSGITRLEDKPADAAARAAEDAKRYANVRAFAEGDTIHFERPGPFGIYRWQRKKTELDEMEKSVWERSRTQQ